MAPTNPDGTPSAAIPEHCYYCFQVIEHELNSSSSSHPTPPFSDDGQEYPLFVTWNIYPSTSSRRSSLPPTPRLRGCIGTFESQPLTEGLAEYASIAAFKDRRFNPISPSELPRLECGVSLLTGFEECDDYLDWEIGVHGIYIHLPNPALKATEDSASSSSSSGASTPAPPAGGRKWGGRSGPAFLTATYLPDVMPEQGWTKTEAIDSAIRKAGYSGKVTEGMRRSLRVRRYRSEKVQCTYEDYLGWKQQQQQQQQ